MSQLLRSMLVCLVFMGGLVFSSSQAQGFDFDTGYAPVEVVIPAAIPAIFQSVSPTAGDATLVLRVTTMITNGWFDAIAPYHPTAIGVYSNLGRRPASESLTNHNKNIAIFYASYRVLNSILPSHAQDWRDMLTSVGLDPDDDSTDLTTPIGIGNTAGNAVVQVREHDGMNQLGDEGGNQYNLEPYADYTGYEPVNTAYDLKDPSRWQPAIVKKGIGLFQVQQFVTPQMSKVLPYSYDNPKNFMSPPPTKSLIKGNGKGNGNGYKEYKEQADEVLAASANLTDEQKMKAEFFDNKILSLGFSALHVMQANQFTLDEFVHYDFLVNVAAFDTAIAIWQEKIKWDAVRPFSAISYIYNDQPVTAWGGPGQGTVSDLPGSEWRSYLPVADHPEYPSGSASFCAAHAEASRWFLDTDDCGFEFAFPQGSSRIEPGITPASDIVLQFPTWTDFETECGLSRLWGGVHFQASIDAGRDIGHAIGKKAYDFVIKHLEGNVN